MILILVTDILLVPVQNPFVEVVRFAVPSFVFFSLICEVCVPSLDYSYLVLYIQ